MSTATVENHRFQFREQVVQGKVALDASTRTARVILITEGLGNLRDKNYYTKDAVASAVQVFDGKQFFVDHPGADEEENRPERSVKDLAGYFSDTALGEVKDPDTGEPLAACFATLHFAESQPGQLALDQVKTALQYQQQFPGSKDVFCGISINAGGISEPGEIEGMEVNVVRQIDDAFSADIVTKPARGGRFMTLNESEKALITETEQKLRSYASSRIRTKLAEGETTMLVKTKKKKVLTEAQAARMRALKAKNSLTEAEAKELKGLKSKIREARAKQEEAQKAKNLVKTGEGEAKADESEDDEDEDDDEQESEGKAAESEDEDEQESEGHKKTSEGEDEEEADGRASEAEGGAGYKKAPKVSLAEGLGGLVKKIEAYLGEDEEEGEGYQMGEDEEEGEDHMPPAPHGAPMPGDGGDALPEPPDDPKALLMDIKTDITKLLQMLAGGEGGAPAPEDEAGDANPMGNELGGAMAKPEMPAMTAMRYSCASCGETNEVLPPKGFQMVKHSEAARPEPKSALREAIQRLEQRLAKKESRMVKSNERNRQIIQENISLKAKLAARERADKAAVALREAKIPADVLSPAELVAFEPSQWGVQIKIAKRSLTREGDIPGGATSRTAGGDRGQAQSGAKVAKETFNQSYEQD